MSVWTTGRPSSGAPKFGDATPNKPDNQSGEFELNQQIAQLFEFVRSVDAGEIRVPEVRGRFPLTMEIANNRVQWLRIYRYWPVNGKPARLGVVRSRSCGSQPSLPTCLKRTGTSATIDREASALPIVADLGGTP